MSKLSNAKLTADYKIENMVAASEVCVCVCVCACGWASAQPHWTVVCVHVQPHQPHTNHNQSWCVQAGAVHEGDKFTFWIRMAFQPFSEHFWRFMWVDLAVAVMCIARPSPNSAGGHSLRQLACTSAMSQLLEPTKANVPHLLDRARWISRLRWHFRSAG